MKQNKPFATVLLVALLTTTLIAQPMRGERNFSKLSDSLRERPTTQRRAAMPTPAELEQLGLRADQQEKLKKQAFEIRRKWAEIYKEIELAQIGLDEALSQWPVDKAKMEKAGNTLSEKRKELSQLHLSALTYLVTLLDKTQHAKWMEWQKNRPLYKKGRAGKTSTHKGGPYQRRSTQCPWGPMM